MHNNIMAAGSKDRPPMLGPGRYSQWRSRFLRYIDTKPNGEGLRKSILSGPYVPSTVLVQAVAATEGNPAIQQHTTIETVLNMTPENKEHFLSEKEAIFLLLTGIGDDIYSTVDACKTANEMWIAIERLQQGESLNVQDVKTNLLWEFGKFTSRDGESMESYYSQFYKLMNELTRNNLQVTTMQVNVQFLQQLQPECQKKIARNANPLALVAAAEQYPNTYYQAPQPHKSYAPQPKASPSTRSHATTKNKGKEIAKPITHPSESASKEDSDPEQAQKDKEMQKNLALIAKYKNVDTSPRYVKDNETGQFGNQRTVTIVGARETVGSQEIPTTDLGTDTKPLEKVQYNAKYNVFTNERQHSEQPESINNTCVVKKGDSNVIPDSPDRYDNDIQTDQNSKECDDGRAALANLIANLTLDTEENNKILKQLNKSNASLTQELKECKSTLEVTNRTLGESNSTRDSCLIALQNKEIGLEKYKTYLNRTTKYETLERKLKETQTVLAQKENDIKEGLKLKAYEISVVKTEHDKLVKQSLLTKSRYTGLVKEKNQVIKDLKLKGENDIGEMIILEKQLMFLNKIVYKRNQSIQTIHMLAPKGSTYNGRPNFENPMYLKKAQFENPCLYEIPYDTSDLANRFTPYREETLTIKQDSRSKLNKDLVKPYDYTKQNNLYEIFKPPTQEYLDQLAHTNEVRKKM
ncbi:hypothetical protein Tco_1162407 [Tanacetum coccineum]